MNWVHKSHKTYVCKVLTPPTKDVWRYYSWGEGGGWRGVGGEWVVWEVQYLSGFLEMLLDLLFIFFSLYTDIISL